MLTGRKVRDFKFRAWHTEKKVMSRPFDLGDEVVCSLDGEYLDIVHSDELIIMQYTGLKDKNGKEIYEGDIVEGNFPYANIGVVVWCSKRCGFYVKPYNSLGKAAYDKYYKMNAVKLKVIGNIYENPEFLE